MREFTKTWNGPWNFTIFLQKKIFLSLSLLIYDLWPTTHDLSPCRICWPHGPDMDEGYDEDKEQDDATYHAHSDVEDTGWCDRPHLGLCCQTRQHEKTCNDSWNINYVPRKKNIFRLKVNLHCPILNISPFCWQVLHNAWIVSWNRRPFMHNHIFLKHNRL